MVTDHIKAVKLAGKKIDGFSERFVELLDRANFPQKGRYSRGAEKFGVRVNSFADWCQKDDAPHYNMLVEIVKILLDDLPGAYEPTQIVSWLQSGDTTNIHPFKEYDIDYSVVGDIYLMLTGLAAAKDVNLDADKANEITRKTYEYIVDQERMGKKMRPVKKNKDIEDILKSKVELMSIGLD